MKKTILGSVAVVVVIALCLGFYFLGSEHAYRSMSVRQVVPGPLAAAMQQDHFYTDYRNNTLQVKGQVAKVQKQTTGSGYIATFATSGAFKAECNLGSGTQGVEAGKTVTILTEGGAAQRLPSAVLLTDCKVLGVE